VTIMNGLADGRELSRRHVKKLLAYEAAVRAGRPQNEIDVLRAERDAAAYEMHHAPTTRKPHRDFAGYVCELRNPLSGGHNVVCDCKRAEKEGNALVESYEEEGGRYQVSCEKHGSLVYCTNMRAARECMKDATSFCDECREIQSGRND
jgi:hypothetical protein